MTIRGLFLIFLFFFLAIFVYCLEKNPHDFAESQCVICHQGDPSSPFSLVQSNSTLACANCHQDILESGFIHPVDLTPKTVKVPRDFPLSRAGLLTCNTCHDVHSPALTGFGTKSYFLRRMERGRAFCASCHSQSTLASQGKSHALYLGEAHFQSKYISSGIGDELDPTSKNCISCHDGSFASSVSINTGSWQHSSNYPGQGLGRKHPIGIDYEMVRVKHNRKTDLRPITMVDQRINFYDGKLGCGSCHDPYSDHDDNLVMSNRRSALCFSCHEMD